MCNQRLAPLGPPGASGGFLGPPRASWGHLGPPGSLLAVSWRPPGASGGSLERQWAPRSRFGAFRGRKRVTVVVLIPKIRPDVQTALWKPRSGVEALGLYLSYLRRRYCKAPLGPYRAAGRRSGLTPPSPVFERALDHRSRQTLATQVLGPSLA